MHKISSKQNKISKIMYKKYKKFNQKFSDQIKNSGRFKSLHAGGASSLR